MSLRQFLVEFIYTAIFQKREVKSATQKFQFLSPAGPSSFSFCPHFPLTKCTCIINEVQSQRQRGIWRVNSISEFEVLILVKPV